MLIRNLSKYGVIIHGYEGCGHFRKSKTECIFGVVQLSNGCIYLVCEFKAISNSDTLDLGKGSTPTFSGTTNKGKPLTIDGELMEINSYSSRDNFTKVFIPTGECHLEIGEKNYDKKVVFRFNITNFIFIGTQVEKTSNTESKLNAIKFQLSEREVLVRKIHKFDQVRNQLESQHDINITCQAVFEDQKLTEIENLVQLVDNLCGLLTIANGTVISWISFEVYSSAGKQIYIKHEPRITRDYSSIPLIDRLPNNSIENFVNKTYPNYIELNPIYDFLALGRIYSSIRVSSFIEVRSLTIVACVEYLLKKSTKYERMSQSLNGKASLRAKLQAFTEYFHIPLKDEDIQEFVKSRNTLVHELSFNTDNWEREYRILVHFLDRLLLGMFGYEGFYINFTNTPHIEGDEADYFTLTR